MTVHFFINLATKIKICEIFPRLDKHLIFDIETQNVNRSFDPSKTNNYRDKIKCEYVLKNGMKTLCTHENPVIWYVRQL